MIRAIRWVLRILNAGNWLFVAGAALLLILTEAGLRPLVDHLTRHAHSGDETAMLRMVELMALIGIAVAVAVDAIFRRLLAMLATVEARRPFQAANARRLRHIAWALLAIQLLDLAFGGVAMEISTISTRPIPWTPGLTGWLAVLLLFVLAQVFASGTQMQDEIEATV